MSRLIQPYSPAFTSSVGSVAAAHLDGSTWLEIDTTLTGVILDSPLFTFSMWVNVAQKSDLGVDVILFSMFSNGAVRSPVVITLTPTATTAAVSASFKGATSKEFDQTTADDVWPGFGQWVNILISAQTDLSAGNKQCTIALNDSVQSLSGFDGDSAFSMGFSTADVTSVGSDVFGGAWLIGDMYDPWVRPGTLLDFSNSALRHDFISSGGHPQDLGSDGSNPGGGTPEIFFHGNAANFGTNRGTGGAFTTNGTLTTAATQPT